MAFLATLKHISQEPKNNTSKGLAARAMSAKHSAVLCCVTLCVPYCACRYMGKVKQCLLG